MDKVEIYEQIIVKLLNDYAVTWKSSDSQMTSQVIIDRSSKHYQLIRFGWKNESYIHSCLFHLDIIGDKVWIQENRTDISIAEGLVREGIDKKDIVLGMLPAGLRKDSEYAEA